MKSKYGTDIDVEQKADELLAALGRELGESRAAYMENLLKETEEESVHKSCKAGRLKRVIILAAVLIIVMGALAVSSEGVRLKLSSLFFREAPGSVEIVDDIAEVDITGVQVTYVPEGFEVLSDNTFGDFNRVIYYGNGEEEIVISVTKTEMYVGNVDSDRMVSEPIKINDKESQLFITDGKHIIVWQIGDCTLQVTTTLDEETAIEIARHVYIR